MRIRRLLSVLLMLALCLSLASCGISRQDGIETTERFLLALQAEDYEAASLLMHPTYRASAEELAEYIGSVEERLGIRFSDGMILSGYTAIQRDNYNATVGGPYIALEGWVDVVSTAVHFTVSILRDQNGYGVFDVKFQNA